MRFFICVLCSAWCMGIKMDNQNENTKAQTEIKMYQDMLELALAKNNQIMAFLTKLGNEAQAQSAELEKKLIDSEAFTDILYRAFTVFIAIQVLTSFLFAGFLSIVYRRWLG